MEYSRLIAVSGMPGLFELISSKNDGAIVKNLEDGTTKFVSSRVHQFSHLESIEIYTQTDNVNLLEVLQAMQSSTETMPSDKDTAAIKSYFGKVFPAMDFDRVYASDMKKMVKWYAILKAHEVELKSSAEEPEEAPADEPIAAEEPVMAEAKVKKAKAPKAEETAPQTDLFGAEVEAAPKKKAAKKKPATE